MDLCYLNHVGRANMILHLCSIDKLSFGTRPWPVPGPRPRRGLGVAAAWVTASACFGGTGGFLDFRRPSTRLHRHLLFLRRPVTAMPVRLQ